MVQALKSVPDEERERAERKVKLRTLGNIRLIAELYKQDVVPEKILHACIQDMLGDGKSEPVEDNVEASSALSDYLPCTTLLRQPCARYIHRSYRQDFALVLAGLSIQ